MPHLHTAHAASPVAAQTPDPLRHAPAGNGLLRSLHGEDPIQAQRTACDAVSRILESDQVGPIHLEALLDLDLHAQEITDRLLNRYVDGGGQVRAFDLRDWISALRLSKKFFQAYERLLRHTQETADHYWLAHAHFVLVNLFHHQQTEFVLRFIRFKKRIPGQWKEIHDAYKFALMRGIAMHTAAPGNTDEACDAGTTLEQQFIRLLLFEVINNGQYSPRDALWADDWFSRWCKVLRLEWHEASGGMRVAKSGFVVDLDGTDALKRAANATARNPLYLDPSPLEAMFDKELESLRNPDAAGAAMTPATRAGKIALLTKLRAIYAPVHVHITRRGERESVAIAVQMITGLPNIIQILREEARTYARVAQTSEEGAEAIALSPLGALTDSPVIGAMPGASPQGVTHEVWQVRDRSDSGSRLRGQIDDLNRIIPGSLIAIREGADAPWIVSVVRRFRRLMVNFVELGVEHIGCRPSVVKMVAGPSVASSTDDPADYAQRRFVALYLPPSARQPIMPIKTLLLPVRKFDADGTVTLLSSKSNYTLRLSEPIQQQFEYLWTSFTVIDNATARDGAESTAAAYT